MRLAEFCNTIGSKGDMKRGPMGRRLILQKRTFVSALGMCAKG